MNIAKISKILLIITLLGGLMVTDTSCRILMRRSGDPEAAARKEDAKKQKKIIKQTKKGVKKYQKEVAGGETEKLHGSEKRDRKKVYKRMKKNKKKAKRINNNKPSENWFVRTFKKDRVKDPFYKIWGRRVKHKWDEIFDKS